MVVDEWRNWTISHFDRVRLHRHRTDQQEAHLGKVRIVSKLLGIDQVEKIYRQDQFEHAKWLFNRAVKEKFNLMCWTRDPECFVHGQLIPSDMYVRFFTRELGDGIEVKPKREAQCLDPSGLGEGPGVGDFEVVP